MYFFVWWSLCFFENICGNASLFKRNSLFAPLPKKKLKRGPFFEKWLERVVFYIVLHFVHVPHIISSFIFYINMYFIDIHLYTLSMLWPPVWNLVYHWYGSCCSFFFCAESSRMIFDKMRQYIYCCYSFFAYWLVRWKMSEEII